MILEKLIDVDARRKNYFYAKFQVSIVINKKVIKLLELYELKTNLNMRRQLEQTDLDK